jgi:hypothetical protein
MTQKNSILMIAVIFFLLLSSLTFLISEVKAAYVECFCTFEGKLVLGTGKSFKKCMDFCGKIVGGQTRCEKNCENCCKEWCSRIEESSSKISCEYSCEKTCDFKNLMNRAISLFYISSGIVAAIVLVLNGIRLFSSENPVRREEAKKGIILIIFALIIIGVGGSLIKMLMVGVVKPSEEEIKYVEGCGGIILNVEHEIEDNRIEVKTKFMNNGDKSCNYRVVLYNKNGEEVGAIATTLRGNGVKTVKISSLVSKLDKEYTVNKEYTVKLFLLRLVRVKEIAEWGPIEISTTTSQ